MFSLFLTLSEKCYLGEMRRISSAVILSVLLLSSFISLLAFADTRQLQKNGRPAVYTLDDVPDPKSSPSWNYVSNPDSVISASTETDINVLIKELEDSTTAQVAVVILNSVGDVNSHDFGVDLFNKWEIGKADKDNGLLILLVMDQHAIEFITGKGMEGALPDVRCKYISETYMIPYAKAGNFDAAVLSGVKAVVMELENPALAEDLYSQQIGSGASVPWYERPVSMVPLAAAALIYTGLNLKGRKDRRKRVSKTEYERRQESKSYMEWKFWLLNVALPVAWLLYQWRIDPPVTWLELIVSFYIYCMILLFEKRMRFNGYIEKQYEGDRHQLYSAYAKSHSSWIGAYIFFPLPFLFYKFWKDLNQGKLRKMPYTCDRCGNTMSRIDENADDAYLSSSQLKEEQLHSVDYDVWHCNNCGNQKILNYVNYFSKYQECPNCKTHAYYHSKTVTLVSPTYSSTGSGEKIFDCLQCHHQDKKHFTIPMLTRSSSSSSSSSGSSGGGSSWGGGSSGGGGSSSHW